MVYDVQRGYNGTVFAYGQTGAGKTFTMEDICYNAAPYEWQCLRYSLMDCFTEGAYEYLQSVAGLANAFYIPYRQSLTRTSSTKAWPNLA